ncbi:MAG: serine/threonine protein kinase [Deltaproteobacteria bacterium]|nr:serine/threonine protein kinase [Deltaproteobacteria bacterium]
MEKVRRTFGQYEIVARIGRGGMAEIFLARVKGPAGFQKIVALKCVHPHLSTDEGFREMFLDEARVAAALDHPAIVQIHGLGEVDGTFYIAMEYVPGQPLHRIIRKLRQAGRRLTPKLGVRIIAPIAAALAFAHDRRDLKGRPLSIVHRDVSPQNILVGYDGAGAKLTDFGIAKAEGRSHGTSGDAVKGKVSYMAPEQVLAETLDARADVFALGIVLYEVLTGISPFKAPNDEAMATMRRIVVYAPPPPSKLAPDLGHQLDAIVQKALRKKRHERYATSRELGEDLERYAHTLGPAPASELAAVMHDLFTEEIRDLEGVLRGIDDPSGLVPLPTFGSRPDIPATVALTLPDTRIAIPARPTPHSGIDVAGLPAAPESPGPDDTIGTHGSWVNYSHPRLERRRTWFWFPLGLAAALLAGGLVFMFTGAHLPGSRPEGVRSSAIREEPASPAPPLPAPAPGPDVPVEQARTPTVVEHAEPIAPETEPGPTPTVVDPVEMVVDLDEEAPHRRRGGTSAPPAPVAPAGEGEDTPDEAAPPTAIGGMGRLTLDSEPWAQVFIGGRLIGDTPIFEQRVPAGAVSVTLVNPELHLRRTVVVTVPRDGVARRRISLR